MIGWKLALTQAEEMYQEYPASKDSVQKYVYVSIFCAIALRDATNSVDLYKEIITRHG